MPKVSIIIPIYNMEKYLARCLDSVINQTLKDIEIICINDGSTDNSLEILTKYSKKDSRITVINKKNGGVASARNAGLKAVKADYIGFVDPDDWIEPETYEAALNKMLEDPELDLLSWGVNAFEENEDGAKYLYRSHLKITGRHEMNDDICFGTVVTVWNKLFRREIIQKNNVFFPHGLLFEDSTFFLTYAANCRYAYYFDKCFYNYLNRGDSITRLSAAKKYCRPYRFLVWKATYSYYEQNKLLKNKKKLLERVFLRIYHAEMKTARKPERINKYAKKLIRKYKLNVKLGRKKGKE